MSTTTAATKNALSPSPAPSGDPSQPPTGAAKTPHLTHRRATWVAGGALLVVIGAAAATVGYRAHEPSQAATSLEDTTATAATGGVPIPANVAVGSVVRAAAPVGRAHAINLPPTIVMTASSTPRRAVSPTGRAHDINLPPTVVGVGVAPAPTDASNPPVGHAHAINLP